MKYGKRVTLYDKGKILVDKYFKFSEFGENTLLKAEEFRQQQSDELGLTKEIWISYFERNKEIPIDIQQYMSGFFDG